MKALRGTPSTEQTGSQLEVGVPMHPVVKAFVTELYEAVKWESHQPTFYALFASDVVFVFGGETFPLHDWMDREVFSGRWSLAQFENVLDDGLTVHIRFFGHRDSAPSYWKLRVAGDKITHLEGGNP